MIDRRAANDRIAAPVPGAALKLKRNCISKLVRIGIEISGGGGGLKKNFFRPFGPQFDQR